MLIHNVKDSMFGGVNQQPAEYRQSTQVEEMINAYPTIDKGLLKRNPTTKLNTTQPINFANDNWTYEYSRGFAGGVDEKYVVMITNAGMEIINVNTGKVYNSADGLLFEGSAFEYLFPFVGMNGYSATTIKDTTFLVNKNRTPTLTATTFGSIDSTPILRTFHYSLTEIIDSPSTEWMYIHTTLIGDYNLVPMPKPIPSYYDNLQQDMYAPTKIVIWKLSMFEVQEDYFAEFYGSSTRCIVDGRVIDVYVPTMRSKTWKGHDSNREVSKTISDLSFESLTAYHSRLEAEVRSALDPNIYEVSRAGEYDVQPDGSYPPIRITKWSGESVSVSFELLLTDIKEVASRYGLRHTILESEESDYLGLTTYHTFETTYIPPLSDYSKDGFIWIKRSDPASVGYTYTFSVVDTDGNSVSGSITDTTTDGAATEIATLISADANFTASAVGSVVRATAEAVDADMERVDVGDSYGNDASYGWAGEVQTSTDLPKTLGFTGSLVKVIGTANNAFATYWLAYEDGQWRESVDPKSKIELNKASMPHVLVRNSNDTFTLKPSDIWKAKKVGDDKTNPPVSFLATESDPSPVIKDVFFFKNRLGFITSRTVILSEVGEYGNFWRTSVAALLDSDRIDAGVDTTKAIELEYATYLEDSVMLFADIQFRLQGGSVLSPSNIQISQTSAYELNRNVRPIFMNDRIFFCVNRGSHSAIMEYFVSESASAKSEANDTTSHCQTYIPQNITKLSGSPINNMLFINTSSHDGILYVYKYHDVDNQRIQAAWFKWIFNGNIYNAFSFGKNLNLLIGRKDSIATEDWVVGTGIWNSDAVWRNDMIWISDSSDLSIRDQFEQSPITPLDYDSTEFIDDNRFIEDADVVYGYNINGMVALDSEVLLRSKFLTMMLEETTVLFEYEISAGSIELVVHIDDGTTYNYIADSSTTSYSMVMPVNYSSAIIGISFIPTTTTDAFVLFPSIHQDSVDGNMLPKLNNYGWSVDGIEMSTDSEVLNQGEWFKEFGEKNIGSLIPTTISIGEWVLSSNEKKDTRGHLKCKTIEISSEEGSVFELIVQDIHRDTTRRVPSKYTVNRKPMIYGDSKNMRTHISNNSSDGFVINTVSFEGNFNTRSKRI